MAGGTVIAEVVFWIAAAGVIYPYLGYPLVLWLLGQLMPQRTEFPTQPDADLPGASLIIPVHNEETRIARKIANTAALTYPPGRLQVIYVSDGSTDGTVGAIRDGGDAATVVIELPTRQGKAAALNAGLDRATHGIVIFSDASIELDKDSLRRIVAPFADPRIGCVSGEDRIAEAGGEGLYGRYELMLRRLESRVHSIVGASGSFYAQRRALCEPFTAGMAPDFLSALRTIDKRYRVITEPSAIGAMTSVKHASDEFERKVRTAIRGMTTLFAHASLINPLRTGIVSLALWSHKILRWTVPFCLLALLASSLVLVLTPFYAAALTAQVIFYLLALGALAGWLRLNRTLPGKVALYFSMVNGGLLAAWYRYGRGTRLELWTPSRR